MSVSILIPAFRPRFLGQAIASALAQGHEDFELIVSDDSGGPDILPVVERFRDPRIRYATTAGRVGSDENLRSLWRLARFDLIKFLFDDDLMTPNAVGDLIDLIEASPDAAMAFGRRLVVDERGRIVDEPPAFPRDRFHLDHRSTAQSLVGGISNPIGEFSNILINRGRGVGETDFLAYRGFEMSVNTDVGFYLNVARGSRIVGQSRLVGAFRRHSDQNSSPAFNPVFAIGICEWELFLRGEYSNGALSKEEAISAGAKLHAAYLRWAQGLPLIGQMVGGLELLNQRIADGDTDVLDDDFRARWDSFVKAVADDKERRAVSPPSEV